MNANANGVTMSGSAKLEELRARKAKREEEAKARVEEQEMAELELEEKLIAKMNGPRGIAFEIVVTDVGIFAVKPPEYVVAKKFNALDKKGDEDVAGFVKPCIVDGGELFTSTIIGNGGIAWRLANACLSLYEASASKKVGKF